MAGSTLTRERSDVAGASSGAADSTHLAAGRIGRRRPAVAGAPRTGGRLRTRVRAQWLVLAAALTVLAGVLVAWAVDRAADRVEVVSIARPVAAGAVLQADDLTLTAIAFDTPVTGLAPATSLQALVGRVATVDLEPGVLLTVGMWADGTELSAGERTVGAVLDAGRFPTGLTQGSTALAVAIGDDVGDGLGDGLDDDTDGSVLVRVLDTDTGERGSLVVTLAVPDVHAADVARLAAGERLVLIGVPRLAATGDSGDSGDTGETGEQP
ncbi:MAG: SAF domain-containing protein [Ilumatobacteraceae bacterium]